MPTALLSVWDKTGLIEFSSSLHKAGWRLIASGGTARALYEAGLEVIPTERITGEAEMLAGRVKTLHPAIHAGILARATPEDRDELNHRGWTPIDLVAVNLYPFESFTSQEGVNPDQAVEMIDVGGVALLRAAAKNFNRVTVLCDPKDYIEALDPSDPYEFRRRMARKAFSHTSRYDAAIQRYFMMITGEPAPPNLNWSTGLKLRYGENPHQEAYYYTPESGNSLMGGRFLQGKPPSYNNLLDLDAAWRAVELFTEPATVVVKHQSPCGIAEAETIDQAVPAAIASDPVSAFGSVIAANREVTVEFVENLDDLFIECLIAPAFSNQARERLEIRQYLRVIEAPANTNPAPYEYRSIRGGMLAQTVDLGDPPEARWNVVTHRFPTSSEEDTLRFAWRAVQSVKSNAVVFAQSKKGIQATVGIGGGQPNRVDCVHIAANRAGKRSVGAVMASDAFFPFTDGIEAARKYGIRAIVQPGGSVRDEEVIAAADEAGMTMIFTGVRHFRH